MIGRVSVKIPTLRLRSGQAFSQRTREMGHTAPGIGVNEETPDYREISTGELSSFDIGRKQWCQSRLSPHFPESRSRASQETDGLPRGSGQTRVSFESNFL